MNRALFALAVAAFGIGTTEFVIMGLLPEVAGDLQVTISKAGLLITAYALGVAIGGPFLAVATTKLPRKATLMGLMGVFILGNLGCALAPNYEILLAARVLTSLCHAAFFGIGAVVAASLVAPEKRAQAMALMFAGLTIANVIGVPLGTWLGQWSGWRSTFWGVTGIGVVALATLAVWLPAKTRSESMGWRTELKALRSAQVWLALSMSVLVSTSMFVLFTYIAPFLREVTGIAPHYVGGVLLLCGVGITAGNLIGARLADWKQMPSLIAIFLTIAVVLAVFALVSQWPLWTILLLCVWGAAVFATCTSLQSRVVGQAKEGANLASTLNIGAFNFGNAIGAWMGAVALERGLPLRDLPWLATGAALVAVGVGVFAFWLEGRKTETAILPLGELDSEC